MVSIELELYSLQIAVCIEDKHPAGGTAATYRRRGAGLGPAGLGPAGAAAGQLAVTQLAQSEALLKN